MLAAQQVIARIAELLVAAATSVGDNWHTDRFFDVDKSELPTGQVFATAEDFTSLTVHYPLLRQHRLTVVVRAQLKAATGLDAAMNALVADILLALEGSQAATTLAPLTGVALLAEGVERLPDESGQADTGTVAVRFVAKFQTFTHDPETLV